MSESTSSTSVLADIIVDDKPVNRAIGTNKSDNIYGYASWDAPTIGNVLIGRGGNDFILSEVWTDGTADGFSATRGDTGNDTIENYVETYGSATGDSSGGLGNDTIIFKAWAFGDERAVIRGVGDGGNDRINMLAFSDDADILAHGGPGNDVIRTALPGSVETDYGLETVENVGRARLIGGTGQDTLIARSGEDNEFTGGRGNDRSILSDGSDVFIFAQTSNQGADRVDRWDSAEDRLVLRGWDETATVTDDGTNVRAEFSNGSSITFAGVGDGTVDNIYDLVDDPGQIMTSWMA